MKLYQYAKNKLMLIPLVNSILESSDQIGNINMLKMRLFHQFDQEMVHLEILQSCWLSRFGLYLTNTIFPKGFVQENRGKKFQYRIKTVKIHDQTFL